MEVAGLIRELLREGVREHITCRTHTLLWGNAICGYRQPDGEDGEQELGNTLIYRSNLNSCSTIKNVPTEHS
jgi:hypothetical protein